MVKRVYWESVKKYAKDHPIIVSSSGIGGVSLIGYLFTFLLATGAISNFSYSPDSVCAGTVDDPCYAYINFTANEDIFIYPLGYDPYGRNTPFVFDPGLKDWKMQRKWGNGWVDYDFNSTCKSNRCGMSTSSETKYSLAWRKGKFYQIRIVAYKNDPYENVKWGGFDDLIDPVWEGVKDERGLIHDFFPDDQRYDFDITLDEWNVSIGQWINENNDTVLQVNVTSINLTKTGDNQYRAKINVTYEGQQHSLVKGLRANQIQGTHHFIVPHEIRNLRITFGESSTLIDGSAFTTATSFAMNTNVAKCSDGKYHFAYVGGGQDLWYGNTTNFNSGSTIKEIFPATLNRVGIICDVNDVLTIYYENANDIRGVNSTDFGTTWNSEFIISSTAVGPVYWAPSGASDSVGVKHFSHAEGSGGVFYTNSKMYGTSSSLDSSAIVAGPSDIEVNSSNHPFVVFVNTTGGINLIDVNRSIKYSINGNGSTLPGRGPSMDIKNINGVDQVWVGYSTVLEDASICNSTMSHLSVWTCRNPNFADTDNIDIAITPSGRIEVIHTKHETTNSNIYRDNSSDGVKWDVDQRLDTVGSVNYPSVQNSHFPIWNRINETGGKVHILVSRISTLDLYYENYTISPFIEDTPPVVTLNSTNGFTSENGIFSLNCSAVDDQGLVNLSVYHNISGVFVINQTSTISSESYNYTQFNFNNVAEGRYVWNCLAYDNNSQSSFAASNKTVIVNSLGNSCNYVSGDWNIVCTDNCVLTENVAVSGDVLASGSGFVDTAGFNITGWTNFRVSGGCDFKQVGGSVIR